MKALVLTLAMFASSSALAITIEGYPSGCRSFLTQAGPTVEMSLYETSQEAVASLNSVVKPKTSVFVEHGPGLEIAQNFKKSRVAAICAAVKNFAGRQKVSVEANENNFLESISVNGVTLKSDAFILLSPEHQEVVTSMLGAMAQLQEILKKLAEQAAQGEGQSEPSEKQAPPARRPPLEAYEGAGRV